jgi:Na+/proline symporter
MWVMLLIIPLLVQWWSTWYPGAEPGGGGYIAQRMFAAKNADHSIKAVLFFNVAHYAIRPWPWIIVALCSLIVFPDLESFAKAFPAVNSGVASHDMGYPAMLTFIPAGLLGLVVTSLVAAYMSTISTHLNWGSSYLVNDVYKRFINKNATDKKQVLLGRLLTVVLMICSMLMALVLQNALQTFEILLQIGAGTGLIFILRWFWWRINAYSEIVAMIVSFLIALYFAFAHESLGFAPLLAWQKLLIGVGITTVAWVLTSYLSPRTTDNQLVNFLQQVNPGGPGWKKIITRLKSEGKLNLREEKWKVPTGIICMIAGSVGVYAFLFGTGMLIYSDWWQGISLFILSGVCGIVIFKLYPKIIA